MATIDLIDDARLASPGAEKALHLAFDDVVAELKKGVRRLLANVVAASESQTTEAQATVAQLSEALSAQLDHLFLESVASRLLTSKDEAAHARRNALMRLLVEADALITLSSVSLSSAGQTHPLATSPDDEDMLSSEKAAKLLHVSRPHLNKLLDNGTIPGVMKTESGHRRISRGAILRYKEQMKQRQAQASEEVTRLSRELGLYDDELEGIPEAPNSK